MESFRFTPGRDFAGDDLRSISQRKILLVSPKIQRNPIFKQLVTDNGGLVRLTTVVPMLSARQFDRIANNVIKKSEEIFQDNVRITKSGYLPLYSQIVTRTLADQTNSFLLAFVVIITLLAIVLGSWRYSLIAIPSNLLPVIFILAFMGFAGIRLDVATVTLAATVFGIIVDDSLHILYNLKRLIASGLETKSALKIVAQKTGSAVVSTSLVLVAGYMVISLGAAKSISYTGILMVIAIISALITDLILLPAVASYLLKRKFGHD